MGKYSSLHRPGSAYRFQLRREFDFGEAVKQLDYLKDLGVEDIYLSPVFEAQPGSEHGYDVTDPTMIRGELGGEEGFNALSEEARRRKMGIILDFVPNHMAASTHNGKWMGILGDGAASPWSHWFDINWRAKGRPGALDTHVLLPILGKPYGAVLESGELKVSFSGSVFFLDYYDWRLPLSPRSWPLVLEPGLGILASKLGFEHPAVEALTSLISFISELPPWTATDPDLRAERYRGVRKAEEWLRELASEIPEVSGHISQNLEAIAGEPGKPESFDWLDDLVARQPYRLCFWKLASERVSYRRFFDIVSLAGVRVENRRVFRETHELLLRLIQEGKVQGIRLDHIDGLLDPGTYLKRLRRAAGKKTYIVVEKILSGHEKLPRDWPVQGTTGYDSLHLISGLFTDRQGLEKLARFHAALPGAKASFSLLVHECKKLALKNLFRGEFDDLVSDMVLAVQRDRHGRDISPLQLADALLEVSAAMPVYRTYLQGYEMAMTDRSFIDHAVSTARRTNPEVDPYAYDMIARLLTLSWPHRISRTERRTWQKVVHKWQQLTGPAMAKGLEDTALYRDVRLLALNEVGADHETIEDPADIPAFHARMADRIHNWSASMNTASTHDSKRSEDLRARLLVLSEMPAEWNSFVRKWIRKHRCFENDVRGDIVPDEASCRFIYQTLLGVWPSDGMVDDTLLERLRSYMIKAAREAKLHTSWIDPDESYEKALLSYLDGICKDERASRFWEQMSRIAKKAAFYGYLNSLSMTHIRLSLPGVPDIYQGNEVWSFDLADPDNRRSVDFDSLNNALKRIDEAEKSDRSALLQALMENPENGDIKLYLVSRLLKFRRKYEHKWAYADYVPLKVKGKRENHLLAFGRRLEDEWIISLAPRLFTGLTQNGSFPVGKRAWGRTTILLPENSPEIFTDILTGNRIVCRRKGTGMEISAAEALSSFPVCLAVSQ